MGKEFENFVSEVIENSENAEVAREQGRMNDELNTKWLRYSISPNKSMDLFTISISEITGTKSWNIEISGPVNFLRPVNDYILQLLNWESRAAINPEAFVNFWVDPNYYISDYERDIKAWLSDLL